jgi:hypothetical protein
MFEHLVGFVKRHQKFIQNLPINTPKRGANTAQSLFSETAAGRSASANLSAYSACTSNTPCLSTLRNRPMCVCQPSWYLIASAAGMLQSVRSSWMYWRDIIPCSHPYLPLSCREPQCYLASQSCHTLSLSRAYNTGSLTGNLKAASEA